MCLSALFSLSPFAFNRFISSQKDKSYIDTSGHRVILKMKYKGETLDKFSKTVQVVNEQNQFNALCS